jgi:hypothetical protein
MGTKKADLRKSAFTFVEDTFSSSSEEFEFNGYAPPLV